MFFFFFQAEDGIRDLTVTGVQTCALPICGTIHLAFEALLDPGTPIPLWVERLTGITDGMVAGRPRFGDVVAGFGRALDAAVFVAHNARFDWRFLAAEYPLAGVPAPGGKPLCTRSEEHTSELQSQSNLVCRLLLEKKPHRLADHQVRHRGERRRDRRLAAAGGAY